MNSIIKNLIEILYIPSEYIHPVYLSNPLLCTEYLNDQLLNIWIIRKYNLDDFQSFLPEDELVKLIILSWRNLPVIAVFLGAFLCRDKILSNSNLIMSQPHLMKFISLPIMHQKINFDKKALSQTFFFRLGLAFILKTCTNLPLCLVQRIKLHSPEDSLPLDLSITNSPLNINLLRMAINYANNT